MSYLVFGKLVFSQALDDAEVEALAWKCVEASLTERLHLSLGCNIVQQIVFEVLEAQADHEDSRDLEFMLAPSPVWNVCDELIDPDMMVGEGGLPRIRESFERFERLFARLLAIDVVAEVVVYASEGYDDEYQRIEVALKDFVDVVFGELEAEEDVPSVRISIRK